MANPPPLGQVEQKARLISWASTQYVELCTSEAKAVLKAHGMSTFAVLQARRDLCDKDVAFPKCRETGSD